ncbi:tautomerase family protein [Gordonia defluvii]|jgi:phenylpyruvate tautomerase PptA (4-oxalocrotonate tautomerase family)|uniref:Tautomerase family protein n=1 Tax=Gordonia defluvii TaxID=283718 RepID=A0ABP6LA37_9ACTN
MTVPHAQIEVRRQWAVEEEVAIINAVHDSLVAAFRIPQGDKHIRLVVHEPHRFAHPPNLQQPEYLTLIHIDCFEGRSVDAKRQLYREIIDRLEPFGIPADYVSITVRDIPTSNWGIRGGEAACDVDLGFDVGV